MGKWLDYLMVALFVAGVLEMLTGIGGGVGIVGVGVSVTYGIALYGVAAIRRLFSR